MSRIILVLTDQPLEYDKRVLSIQEIFKEKVSFYIIKNKRTKKSDLYSFFMISLISLFSIVYLGKVFFIIKREKIKTYKFKTGLRVLFKYISRVVYFYQNNKIILKKSNLIYANDQLSGIVALINFFLNKVNYIYDCHEVVPFRARKVGLMRMSVEAFLEKYIIKFSKETYVVNNEICLFYKKFYGNYNINVRNNNFYKKNIFYKKPLYKKAILYIGSTPKGRHVSELLNMSKNTNNIEILLAISDIEEFDYSLYNVKRIDFFNYEKILEKEYKHYMIYMWMSFDSAIYSYRLSLPNKFFQAMSFGYPIIVSENTYLEKLVNKYKIGVVNKKNILNSLRWDIESYLNLSKNIISLEKEKL